MGFLTVGQMDVGQACFKVCINLEKFAQFCGVYFFYRRFVIFHVKILLDDNRKPYVIDVDCDPGLQTMGSETFRAR